MALSLDNPSYQFIKMTAGALATFGIYTMLYRETKIYRFFEHMFLGLAAGLSLTLLWTETLKEQWWDRMVGSAGEGASHEGIANGNWAWVMIIPLAFMAYLIFSRKHNWMSRIPIGLLIGLGAGQGVLNWFNTYGPQIGNSIKPVIPTTFSSIVTPVSKGLPQAQADVIRGNVYTTQAINNVVFLLTLLCVLSYFIFCTEFKSKVTKSMSVTGRMVLMVGFGAIFGTTIMTRFALFIDRMYFVWVEWVLGSIQRLFGG